MENHGIFYLLNLSQVGMVPIFFGHYEHVTGCDAEQLFLETGFGQSTSGQKSNFKRFLRVDVTNDLVKQFLDIASRVRIKILSRD